MTPVEAARIMARYAKEYSAGAFGSPLASDIKPRELHAWQCGDADEWVVALIKKLARDSQRTDWTGAPYTLPAGASVCTFLARTPHAQGLPDDLRHVDFVFAYPEDPVVANSMRMWHRGPWATNITATSQIIRCYAPPYSSQLECQADLPTADQLPSRLLPHWGQYVRDAVLGELQSLSEWHDDYPYYSDGTWGAVNLRGFNPADPLWGVKPGEMPKKWKAAHPDWRAMECGWTTITARLPAMRALVEDVPWWRKLERVRLMRMAARTGGGKLARHSDVTDKTAGTRPGQIARFHVPLVSHPDVKMSVWELDGSRRDVHLEPWTVWYLDQRKPHAVANPSPVDRVHLVVDVVVDEVVRRNIEALV